LGQEALMSQAVITLAPINPERPVSHASNRPNSDFVAHLIAMSIQAPQTRLRRRAEPEEAVAAYNARGRHPAGSGRTLSRSF
jgi:hypothetical protein